MPTKERYARDKAYYEAYHRSDSYKLKVVPARQAKYEAQGKCKRCGQHLIEGASSEFYCINCNERSTQQTQIRRSLF